LETGISASTAGLQISEKSDNEATWTDYTQAASTINSKSSAIGVWETPDAGDVHFSEAQSEGCYQIDFPNTTWSNTGAKYVQILIKDTSSPTFADTMVTVNLNAISADTLVDDIFDEPCAGHVTSDTTGDQICDQAATDTSNIRGDVANLTNGSSPVWVVGYTIATGDCDSGSTLTCVDASLNQSDAGYWSQGVAIVFTSGTNQNQPRCITSFVPATDTVGFYPATTQAVSTNDYVLFSAPTCRNFP
jgi:hypothetical protein